MALKRDYHERCKGCLQIIARGTNRGVAVDTSACTCKDDGPADDARPQSPPRTVSWHSATLIDDNGKIKWLCHTIFLALEDDVWHDRDVIEKGKYYWLDETWGIGGKSCNSMLEAQEAQRQYGEQL